MKKVLEYWKLIIAAFAALLILILVLQNKDPVTTEIFFATVVMPLAAMLALTFVTGFAVGLLVSWGVVGWRRKRSK